MIKFEVEELNTLKLEDYNAQRKILAVSPITLKIITTKINDDEYTNIARLTWLCKDSEDKLFCLTSSYILENEKDSEFIVQCPFIDSKYFVNYSLNADIIMSSLDHYFTDLRFTYENIKNAQLNTNDDIYCLGCLYSLYDEDPKLYKLYVSPQAFSTLLFVDQYILNGKINTGDLYSALLIGSDECKKASTLSLDDAHVDDVCIYQNHIVTKITNNIVSKHDDIKLSLVYILYDEKTFWDIADVKNHRILNKHIKKNTLENLIGGSEKDPNVYIQCYKFAFHQYGIVTAKNINDEIVLFIFRDDILVKTVDDVQELLKSTENN